MTGPPHDRHKVKCLQFTIPMTMLLLIKKKGYHLATWGKSGKEKDCPTPPDVSLGCLD